MLKGQAPPSSRYFTRVTPGLVVTATEMIVSCVPMVMANRTAGRKTLCIRSHVWSVLLPELLLLLVTWPGVGWQFIQARHLGQVMKEEENILMVYRKRVKIILSTNMLQNPIIMKMSISK